MQYIPLSNASSQTLEVVLGNRPLTLDVRWSPLTEHWYLSVQQGNTILVSGRQLTMNEVVFKRAELGGFAAVALRGDVDDPLRDGWNVTHALAWLTPQEIESLV